MAVAVHSRGEVKRSQPNPILSPERFCSIPGSNRKLRSTESNRVTIGDLRIRLFAATGGSLASVTTRRSSKGAKRRRSGGSSCLEFVSPPHFCNHL